MLFSLEAVGLSISATINICITLTQENKLEKSMFRWNLWVIKMRWKMGHSLTILVSIYCQPLSITMLPNIVCNITTLNHFLNTVCGNTTLPRQLQCCKWKYHNRSTAKCASWFFKNWCSMPYVAFSVFKNLGLMLCAAFPSFNNFVWCCMWHFQPPNSRTQLHYQLYYSDLSHCNLCWLNSQLL